ncbi:TGBp1 [Arachis pintoi virus]|uniref:TGBp1 n=1 Tax=Arachis pintoi virus TaxID=1921009 RepID=A0A3G1GJ48_9VIRU|nr:TGBp1 [Arachis pintoi virus]APG31851.1 TGBp1 [Arachis pintoi virus]
MSLTQLEDRLITAGFTRTNQPLAYPIVVHGVPGCGKSTLIKTLIEIVGFKAATTTQPYGRTLSSCGVTSHPLEDHQRATIRILDEYQNVAPTEWEKYQVLIGDPFQGPYSSVAHYVKATSHRVPKQVADFLRARSFDIYSDKEGSLTTTNPYSPKVAQQFQNATILHLGPISKQLLQSHSVPSICWKEFAGQEDRSVTLVYHSTELQERTGFYVAATRALENLTLVSDEFNEFHTTP